MKYYTKQEEIEVEKQYQEIIDIWKKNRGDENTDNVRKAFELAKKVHGPMRRRTGEPYLYHPIAVAKIVAQELGLGETSIISAFLHDVVEDSPEYTIEDIKNLFNEKVAYIVEGLTKIKDGFQIEQVSASAENIKRMILTLSKDVRVVLVKFADRLHNMRTLDAMPPSKQKDIAAETMYLYAPLAHRLGLYNFKSEFEDLSLKYLEPEVYHSIKNKIEFAEEERNKFSSEFISPIKEVLVEKGYKFTIDSRIKTVYSIYQKMKKKGIPFQEIYDVFAIRIVVDVPIDKDEKKFCFNIYSEITKLYRPKANRIRDWISTPKANGYEALHVTVMSNRGEWVEVQIRSKRMDDIAEKGLAAHWKYKENFVYDFEKESKETLFEEWINSVREILISPNVNALLFLDDFKRMIDPNEVFVYTPKGKIFSLPFGSVVLDFAYAVHTNIGNHAIAATIDRKWVTLSQQLKTGDKVEIITSEKSVPQQEWLDFVKTSRAIKAIKESLREIRKEEILKGKKILEKRIKKFKYSTNIKYIQRLSIFAGLSGVNDLYYEAYLNNISDDTIHSFYSQKDYVGISDKPIKTANLTSEQEYQLKDNKRIPLEVDKLDFNVAKCCHPIPGDDIIAYNYMTNKWTIHGDNCQEAVFLMTRFPNKINHPIWSNSNKQKFISSIIIKGIDSKGILSKIIDLIKDNPKTELKALNVNTEQTLFTASIILGVESKKELNIILSELLHIEHIKEATRNHNFTFN